jgi:N-acetylmuramoyl-L-alanine amidase
MLRLVTLFALGLSTASLTAQPLTGGPSASFVPPGGTSLVVRSLDIQGRAFLSVNDVLAALGGSVQFDDSTFSYELKLKSHSAVVGVETPIAVVDTRLVSLSTPVHGVGSTLFADPDFFQKVVGPMAGTSFVWERSSRLLSARKADLPEVVVEATLADFEATTKIVLRLTEVPAFRVEKGEETLVIRFPAARLTASPPEMAFDDPRVARLAVRGSEVYVSLRERNLSTNVYALQTPPRIVVDVTKVAATSGRSPGAAPPPSAPAKPQPKTIVLDPGHGGTEEGAKGPGGAMEKDATLALVKSIRETLFRNGYRVVTTRETDTTVGLDERPALANAAKPDLFLSIHCNASRSPSAHGTEVYYLSLDASDRAAAALAEKENRTERSATPTADRNAALRDLDLILWDLAQNQHLSASARLAEIIQADFNRLLGVTTRGVKQAPFRVLIGANVPAVLVEVAFITNPEEEKKLASEDFRRQVAETVVGSLATYFRNADGAAPVPPVKTR